MPHFQCREHRFDSPARELGSIPQLVSPETSLCSWQISLQYFCLFVCFFAIIVNALTDMFVHFAHFAFFVVVLELLPLHEF